MEEITRRSKLTLGLSKLIAYLIGFWLIFLLAKTLWLNWQLAKSIEKINQQIAVLEQQKKDLNNLILYYQSDSFKELEGRRKLGLKKPGEKVMILPASAEATAGGSATPAPMNPASGRQVFPEELTKEKESINPKTPESKIPNWLLWWEFYTK